MKKKYGRLTIVGRVIPSRNSHSLWFCKCVCGNTVIVERSNLGTNTNSCGCLQRELLSQRSKRLMTIHGESRPGCMTDEYRCWAAMRQRCLNQNHTGYSGYGGRGIKICARWSSYINFLKDMGRKPGPDYSIDRINVNGNYEPLNCRWANHSEQMCNRRPYKLKRKRA
jgi:hypothetical protein